MYTLQTRQASPTYNHYIMRVDPKSYHIFTFHVRACSDAHVLLMVPFERAKTSKQQAKPLGYEVIIGAEFGQESWLIRTEDDVTLQQAETPDILQ